jgi:hypothetical protein
MFSLRTQLKTMSNAFGAMLLPGMLSLSIAAAQPLTVVNSNFSARQHCVQQRVCVSGAGDGRRLCRF